MLKKPMAYIQVKGRLLVNGTAEQPVDMFASGLYPGFEVKIYSTDHLNYYGETGYNKGYAELNYARVMNPNLAVSQIDQCYFGQDLFNRIYKRYLDKGEVKTTCYDGPAVIADNICNSRFYQLGCNISNSTTIYKDYMLQVRGNTSGNLFDSCVFYMDQHHPEQRFPEDINYLSNSTRQVLLGFQGHEFYSQTRENFNYHN